MALEHRLLAEHRLPLWDPYDGYSMPFAASMQSQPFYPPTALLALHPSPRAYAWYIAFRLFLAGWFAALFLRLFADRVAALAAGVATALTGYYLLYYNMPHLSVDVALPMLLFATELVFRRRSPLCIALLASATGLVYLGAMPETESLVLIISALYAVVRWAAGRKNTVSFAAAFAGANVLGFGLGAIQTLPFVEFWGRSFNGHDARAAGDFVGLASDTLWARGLLLEFAPRAFGPPWNSILTNGAGHSGVRGFFGCAAFFLATLAVVCALKRRDTRSPIVLFLTALAAFAVLKRYGNPLVQWTGTLPIFSLINFPKYTELVLGVAVALLAGFGVAYLRERTARMREVWIAFGLSLGSLSGLFVLERPELVTAVSERPFWSALIVALIALFAAALAARALAHDPPVRVRAASLALVALLAAEPFAAYIERTIWADAPPVSENPYAGAPYLSFLQQNDRDAERIFGSAAIPFPNWSGAFGLADPRSLNALYPARFLPFVDAFVAPHPATFDDQADRFTATRAIDLNAPLVRRWLALSSIGYIVDPRQIAASPPGSILAGLWTQVSATLPDSLRSAVRPATAELDGVAENVLFEHPPNAVSFALQVPSQRTTLAADIALDPSTYAGPSCGGAVTFIAQAQLAGKNIAALSKTIDPKHLPAQRHWIPFTLDLSAARGHTVQVRMATAAPNLCAAWAEWGEPRLVAKDAPVPLRGASQLYSLAFASPGANVYRVPGSLPRLWLVHRTVRSSSFAESLHDLTAPAFDVRTTAVVEQPLPELGAASATDRVTVTSRRSDLVTADVDAAGAALLVQNDTWYPGWVATVDGHDVPIVQTDGLFRGVVVPAGHNEVAIAYRSAVVRLSEILSAIALLIVLILFGLGFTRRPAPAPIEHPPAS
jgi:hypothetical protein